MAYTGLAIFPADTEVFHNTGYEFSWRKPEDIGETFVRDVVLVPPLFSFCSLEKLLIRTDAQLDRVAAYVGGRVVPHQWGLIRRPSTDRYRRNFNHMLGGSYYLTAEVSRIEPAEEIPSSVSEAITNGVERFNNRPSFRRKLNDINPGQFVYGHDANSVNKVILPYLVDIEPLYRMEIGIM